VVAAVYSKKQYIKTPTAMLVFLYGSLIKNPKTIKK
jgi:hypothetical protein